MVMSDNLNVSEIRKTLRWTRRQMADATGVDRSTVSRWESKAVSPSGPARVILEKLKKRADAIARKAEAAA